MLRRWRLWRRSGHGRGAGEEVARTPHAIRILYTLRMSGAIANFREGTRSEYLAQFAFSCIGFVIPVPRQEDFMLTDLFVHLHSEIEGRGVKQLVPMGQAIAVQIKSNTEPIELTAAQLALVVKSEVPWFIAVCDRARSRLDVFSTIDRHFFYRFTESTSIRFDPRPLDTKALRESVGINVGPPIISVHLDALEDFEIERRRTARAAFRAAVRSWAISDAINIAALREGASWVLRPQGVQPGEVFDASKLVATSTTHLMDAEKLAASAILRLVGLREALSHGAAKHLNPELLARIVMETEQIKGFQTQ